MRRGRSDGSSSGPSFGVTVVPGRLTCAPMGYSQIFGSFPSGRGSIDIDTVVVWVLLSFECRVGGMF